MDLLRRIFGLQPAPTPPTKPAEKRPVDNGATAPLSPDKQPAAAGLATSDPASTNIFDDEGKTRRLPDMEAVDGSRVGRQMSFGLHSDVGQVRSNNQDAVYSFLCSSISADEHPELGIFIVADGMGGHHDGERASSTAARAVARYASNEIYLPMLRREEASAERPTITEILRNAIQDANLEVSKEVPEGGTTVTAVAIIGDLAYVAHVGDSRAYLLSDDGIEQLTRDHSLVQRLIELDQLTPEEAAEHPQRNVLYRAIGQNDSIDVDTITRRLARGSRLLLCSDGLWNLIPADEIRTTVYSSPSPQMACEALVKLANARGGPDNITVTIIKMPD